MLIDGFLGPVDLGCRFLHLQVEMHQREMDSEGGADGLRLVLDSPSREKLKSQ